MEISLTAHVGCSVEAHSFACFNRRVYIYIKIKTITQIPDVSAVTAFFIGIAFNIGTTITYT
jgi:hypothetical protein